MCDNCTLMFPFPTFDQVCSDIDQQILSKHTVLEIEEGRKGRRKEDARTADNILIGVSVCLSVCLSVDTRSHLTG